MAEECPAICPLNILLHGARFVHSLAGPVCILLMASIISFEAGKKLVAPEVDFQSIIDEMAKGEWKMQNEFWARGSPNATTLQNVLDEPNFYTHI